VLGCSHSVYYDPYGLDRKLNYQFKIPYFKNKTVGILSKDIFFISIPGIRGWFKNNFHLKLASLKQLS
jgi:hypothetical protein